jgi:hypothetical protein
MNRVEDDRSETGIPETRPEKYDGVDTSHSSQNDEVEDPDSEEEDFASYQDDSISEVLMGSISGTIDRLYRLSFKIRNPAMRIGLSKALTYHKVDESTRIDLIDQYAEADENHIREIFRAFHHTSPDGFKDQYLIKRLAEANKRRRQQFGYWMERKANFERLSKPGNLEEVVKVSVAPQDPQGNQNLPISSMPQLAPSQPSTATKLDVSKINLDDDSSVISTSTFVNMANEAHGDQVSIPGPPMKYYDDKEFECPYCFTMCPQKMLNKRLWE